MSLKPQPPREMPEETARIGNQLLASESPYRLVGEQLYAKYRDEDFVDLYPAEGQPGLSPVDLAFVTAFQYMEDLADRAAAEAVRLRLDWKYALHLPLEDAGFNFSVLSEYRARLVQHQAEGRVFEALLGDLQELGLLKRRGRQRTDSLAVLTRVRYLNRLELVVETLRVALRALLASDPEWTRATVAPTWEARYGERCVAERLSDAERTVLQNETGRDGQWLLERLAAPGTPAHLTRLPEVQVLRTVWEQQYEVREREVVFRAPGPYDGETRIQTPHDPEARYSKKREQEWIGDKLQVTETDDEELPHLITDIAITSSVAGDQQALGEIQSRQTERGVAPGERMVDQGYVSGATLEASTEMGEDLVGPAPGDHSPQERRVVGSSSLTSPPAPPVHCARGVAPGRVDERSPSGHITRPCKPRACANRPRTSNNVTANIGGVWKGAYRHWCVVRGYASTATLGARRTTCGPCSWVWRSTCGGRRGGWQGYARKCGARDWG